MAVGNLVHQGFAGFKRVCLLLLLALALLTTSTTSSSVLVMGCAFLTRETTTSKSLKLSRIRRSRIPPTDPQYEYHGAWRRYGGPPSSSATTLWDTPDSSFSLPALVESSEDGGAGKKELHDHLRHHLVFPGGGIFFFWQAGVVTYLREQGYCLLDDHYAVTMAGASAGALTATLTATGVDFYKATELALQLSKEADVWNRSNGLQGIWGPLIDQWLEELLPDDAVERLNHRHHSDRSRLALLVTPLPGFGKDRIDQFQDRQDLIRCNMASVHLPWFLDGKLTTSFRNRPHIDGSFLARQGDYVCTAPKTLSSTSSNNNKKDMATTSSDTDTTGRRILTIDYNQDPKYAQQDLLSFVQVLSEEGVWEILENGKRYARQLESQGFFSTLPLNKNC